MIWQQMFQKIGTDMAFDWANTLPVENKQKKIDVLV